MTTRLPTITLLALVAAKMAVAGNPAPARPLLGLAPWPSGLTPHSLMAAQRRIRSSADMVSFAYENVPWVELLQGRAYPRKLQEDIAEKKQERRALRLLLTLSPLNKDHDGLAAETKNSERNDFDERSKVEPSTTLRGKWLSDPEIQQAYAEHCRRMVLALQPDFLVVGSGAAELLKKRPAAWEDYCALTKFVVARLRREFPKLRVGQSVALHDLLKPGTAEPAVSAETIAKLGKLIDLHDFNGASVHPVLFGLHTEAELAAALGTLRLLSAKPAAITDASYPAETVEIPALKIRFPSSPTEQETFVRVLLDWARTQRSPFVVWSAGKDLDALWDLLPEPARSYLRLFRDSGLIDEDDQERPAYRLWTRTLKGQPIVSRRA